MDNTANNIRPNGRLLRLARLANNNGVTAERTGSTEDNLPSYEEVVVNNLAQKNMKVEDSEKPPPSYESIVKISDTQPIPSSSQLPRYNDVAGLADAPPTYHSIFTDAVLRVINPFSDENNELTSTESSVNNYKVAGVMINIVLFVILISFVVLLPVSMVAVGITYIHDCPVQPRIPIYLIVLGFFQMLECCGRLGYKMFQTHGGQQRNSWRDRYRRKDPLVYFVIVWFVIGSMWVYQTNPECQDCHSKEPVKMNHTTDQQFSTAIPVSALPTKVTTNSVYCNMTVYNFAFWVITMYYSIIGFFCFLILIDVVSKAINKCCHITRLQHTQDQ